MANLSQAAPNLHAHFLKTTELRNQLSTMEEDKTRDPAVKRLFRRAREVASTERPAKTDASTLSSILIQERSNSRMFQLAAGRPARDIGFAQMVDICVTGLMSAPTLERKRKAGQTKSMKAKANQTDSSSPSKQRHATSARGTNFLAQFDSKADYERYCADRDLSQLAKYWDVLHDEKAARDSRNRAAHDDQFKEYAMAVCNGVDLKDPSCMREKRLFDDMFFFAYGYSFDDARAERQREVLAMRV